MFVPTMSALETLRFHARLRIGGRRSAADVDERMRMVLETMGLWRSRNTQVGGTLPGPLWRDSMEIALKGTEPTDFEIKNKYGLTTKDPYVAPTYTYVAPTDEKPADAAPEPETFSNPEPPAADVPATPTG